jgi:hypothetical protein
MFYKCYYMENIFTFAILCKGMAGRRRKCQVYSGQSKKIRKVFLGQVTFECKVQAIYVYMACTLHQRK